MTEARHPRGVDSLTPDLFGGPASRAQVLGPGAALLRGFALPWEASLLAALEAIALAAPFRYMVTPGGFAMSVAMSNAGRLGWISDTGGYRYVPLDPLTGKPWPPLPVAALELARGAAAEAGFADFVPDACLINRYRPGTRLSLHQDRDEGDLAAPIVSVSLGLPAVFLFGGLRRAERPLRLALGHGDVVVWGGPARLRYHGILPVAGGCHPVLGPLRINLSFRKVR